MKFFLLLLLLPFASSLTVVEVRKTAPPTVATRRHALEILLLGSLAYPQAVGAFSQQLDDYAYEPSQQATSGKLDLNSAFVGDYKVLRGMFPSAAGKIASHGPYKTVKDIYNIPGLTSHDIEMFKKYEKEFTIKMPAPTLPARIYLFHVGVKHSLIPTAFEKKRHWAAFAFSTCLVDTHIESTPVISSNIL
eukprot:scaffold6784_cov108-Cylindrotheca_fusiformis.AAC.2